MSNELNNIISLTTNGVYEGVAIGGDRYPGTTFMDHLLRYEADPEVKLLVMLGEVGGIEEHQVCKAIQEGRISKPLVAWCIGTCAGMFSSEVKEHPLFFFSSFFYKLKTERNFAYIFEIIGDKNDKNIPHD